ncbi:tricarballylate utilization 4Fe-4S protein TcuB [Jatrophihabitans sp. DSM 45814]
MPGAEATPPLDPGGRTSLDLLVSEATRQLTVCNACRYCEGLCAVFPALERRRVLEGSDISQLANLCHDCRACFDACMYDAPHEFAIDVPKALAAVRVLDYDRYVWPTRVPRLLRGWTGLVLAAVGSALLLLAVAVAYSGWPALVTAHPAAASPYDLVPYPALLAIMLAAGVYAVAVMFVAGRRFWSEVNTGKPPISARAVGQAIWYAATLRYLRGGGVDCYYPEDDKPSPVRRWLHSLLAYGFALCLVSTIAAGIEQDILGIDPPYSWLSVPVLAGTIGGFGLVLGGGGLIYLKSKSSTVTSVAAMTVKDYGLLAALTFLGASGLATLFTRETSAYGIVLLIHLAAVIQAFAMAPYSKFIHVIFRFEALVRDNVERSSNAK